MKDIDQLVKKALENHELPYDNGAWEAMAKRLDATPKSPFYKKWWVAASAGLILVSSATYFAFHTSETTQPTVSQTKVEESANATPNTLVAQNPAIDNQNVSTSTTTKAKNNLNNTTITTENGTGEGIITGLGSPSNKTPKRPALPKYTISETQHNVDPKADPIIVKDEHIALQFPDHVCLKSDLVIQNPYASKNLTIVLPSKEEITVKPGQKTSIDCNKTGEISVYVNNKLEKSIEVVESKALISIAVDPTLIYENGIPAVRFSAPGFESKVSWDSGKIPNERDNTDFIVHPYSTQDITVTASMTDENGCIVEETKTIQIAEKYNLMAMNAFSPNSSNARNVGFMPYALQERNTPFTLYIYDPKTGRVIFTSTDVANPWNGYDKTLSETVPQGSIWLWKVVLQNPNPGEPHEYKGTVRIL